LVGHVLITMTWMNLQQQNYQLHRNIFRPILKLGLNKCPIKQARRWLKQKLVITWVGETLVNLNLNSRDWHGLPVPWRSKRIAANFDDLAGLLGHVDYCTKIKVPDHHRRITLASAGVLAVLIFYLALEFIQPPSELSQFPPPISSLSCVFLQLLCITRSST
jgi:hypothetical protein